MLFKRTLAGILVVFMYRTNKMWSHTGILALTYSSCYTTKIATYVEHMLNVCLTYVHEHMLNIKNEQHMFNISLETYI